jgi:hypothetical protein
MRRDILYCGSIHHTKESLTMNPVEPHEMELLHTDESGMEEWHCSICGRRFLMSWPPAYLKTVLVPGDIYATHLGGKGGLRMGTPSIMDVETYLPEPEQPAERAPEPRLEDDLLDPWRRAINQLDTE